MHVFIFTVFIIAIKTGHSIPERLFGKENNHGAGARRSVAERRQDRAVGQVDVPISVLGGCCCFEEGEQSKDCSFCCPGFKEHRQGQGWCWWEPRWDPCRPGGTLGGWTGGLGCLTCTRSCILRAP